jgi:acyl dehydratase
LSPTFEERPVMMNQNLENEMAGLYLEDFQVGQRFQSGTASVDEEQIRTFAQQFDPQPFHLDAAAGKASFFGGLVASGWHTAAITMRLLVESGLPIAGGIIGAGGEITWPNPVRPGALLHVESEILEVRPSRSRPTVASSRSVARLATKWAWSFRCWSPSSSCHAGQQPWGDKKWLVDETGPGAPSPEPMKSQNLFAVSMEGKLTQSLDAHGRPVESHEKRAVPGLTQS